MAGQYTRTETIQKNLYAPGSKQYLPTNLGNGSFVATYLLSGQSYQITNYCKSIL